MTGVRLHPALRCLEAAVDITFSGLFYAVGGPCFPARVWVWHTVLALKAHSDDSDNLLGSVCPACAKAALDFFNFPQLMRKVYVEQIDLTDFPFVQCDRYFTHEFSYFLRVFEL
ncbi:hypothetical protein LBW56_16430 [Ralstonia solanacearum]|uniref:hypothetical protein n=1 Tax=Ralstonia solanacearum TaxID=305 RepID=UPI001FFB5731|nr:hypothetical protein [Ralstonia solanacearum]MDB0528275.1 hypothetical protein [Ralstonia solanacearum]